MDIKQQKLEKERLKALGDLLIDECKASYTNMDSIETILQSGADIDYKNSKPLYWACKLHKFDLVKYLINKGATLEGISRTYLATMCDYKGFNDELEPEYFGILDMAHTKSGDYMALFTPYINAMAVQGRLEKIKQLQARYFLTEYEIVECIYIRIIFEMVLNEKYEMLSYVGRHKKWINQESYDLAVSSGEIVVLNYMIDAGAIYIAGDTAIAQAVYEGYFDVLNVLIERGYKFLRKELFLEKACRAAYSKGIGSFRFLLRHGYTPSDIYKGKTILDHARTDSNQPLIEYLKGL